MSFQIFESCFGIPSGDWTFHRKAFVSFGNSHGIPFLCVSTLIMIDISVILNYKFTFANFTFRQKTSVIRARPLPVGRIYSYGYYRLNRHDPDREIQYVWHSARSSPKRRGQPSTRPG